MDGELKITRVWSCYTSATENQISEESHDETQESSEEEVEREPVEQGQRPVVVDDQNEDDADDVMTEENDNSVSIPEGSTQAEPINPVSSGEATASKRKPLANNININNIESEGGSGQGGNVIAEEMDDLPVHWMDILRVRVYTDSFYERFRSDRIQNKENEF